MEKTVTEKSNLLVDYVRKFINQMGAKANPSQKSTESQSIISSDGLSDCEKMSIDVENCIPYINYLDNKHRHFLGLSQAFNLITKYFTTAARKCDNVLNKLKCQRLIVSR